ncbi:MAG: TonB-dependent receptor, partial [Bacteroidetes bacterium]|nr:TonB-dependent receptor [Bacteroidota bacterium]
NPGLLNVKLNTAEAGNSAFSLAELMSRNSTAFIKQYGHGALSSPSLRGTGAAHTALVWNGINLQSNMNGQQDLSLFPAMLFDAFRIQEGSSNSAWGSGAIGGTIFLESNAVNKNHIRIGSNAGSFGLSQQFADLAYTGNKISIRTRAFRTFSLNNFTFEDISLPSKPLKHQHNSKINMYGIMQDIGIKTGKFSKLDFSVWVQQASRQLPPILTVPVSVAKQFDKSIRANARYQYIKNNSGLKINLAVLDDYIHYQDSLLWQDSHNKSRSYIAEISYNLEINHNHKVEIGHLYTLSEAKADGYSGSKHTQNRPAFFGNLRSHFFNNKTNTLLSVRQELLNGKALQSQVSLAASHIITNFFKVRSQIATTYRIPTLNDLYWVPGGNPNLQPEQGISAEMGADLNLKTLNEKLIINVKPGIFYNKISNWIQWSPTASYWTPMNLQNVGSLGYELRTEINYHFSQKQSVSLIIHAQHVNAEILRNDHSPDLQGKQLIYVPGETASCNLNYRVKNTSVLINYNLISERFVTTNNSEFLPAYQLININISQEILSDAVRAKVFFGINNITNQIYQVVLRRPMPMRNWQAGIQFEF